MPQGFLLCNFGSISEDLKIVEYEAMKAYSKLFAFWPKIEGNRTMQEIIFTDFSYASN